MKEILYDWVKDLTFYTLLMRLVLHVLPEQGEQKYLRFFMGVVMIVLVLSPFLRFMGLDQTINGKYSFYAYEQEVQEFQKRQEKLERTYEEKWKEEILGLQEKQGETGERDERSKQGIAIGIEEIKLD